MDGGQCPFETTALPRATDARPARRAGPPSQAGTAPSRNRRAMDGSQMLPSPCIGHCLERSWLWMAGQESIRRKPRDDHRRYGNPAIPRRWDHRLDPLALRPRLSPGVLLRTARWRTARERRTRPRSGVSRPGLPLKSSYADRPGKRPCPDGFHAVMGHRSSHVDQWHW